MFEMLRPTVNGIKYNLGILMEIEVTDRCNLRCSICKHVSNRKNVDMSLDTFKEIISKLRGQTSIKLISLFWRGEPTLNSALPQMAEICKDEGYKTSVSTNTATINLHNEEYVKRLLASLDYLYLSLDGYDKASLQKYRGGADWDVILKNLETIGKILTTCDKTLKVLMFKHNEENKNFFRGIAKKYQIPRVRFTPPVINGKPILTSEEADKWLPKSGSFLRYDKKGDAWIHRSPETCRNPPVISVTGEVCICCNDWKLQHSIGNILRDGMKEIEDNFAKIIQQKTKRQLTICKENCFSLLGYRR